MNVIDRLFGRKAKVLDQIPDFLWGPASKTGIAVNWATALQVTTVLACCRVIAEGLAQVPFEIRRRNPGGFGSTPALDHPAYGLLHRKPNGWMTSFELREMIALHLVLCGNAYLFKSKSFDGRLLELIPLEPGRVSVTRNADFSLTYQVSGEDGSLRTFDQSLIWHIRGPSWNGWMGMESVKLAREAIGLSLALEAAHARLHKNGVQPSGVYTVANVLTEDQHKKLSAWLRKEASGDLGGAPLILDNGANWLSRQMTGVDAQHVETRRLQIEEVCRAMRVMPIMVGAADKTATYASAEQMFIAHAVHTLAPWAERIEQSADVALLGGDPALYTVLDLRGLMRGALKDQAEYYAKALGAGGGPAWMTQDEVRVESDLNPMGGTAATLREPSNVAKTPPPVAA